MNYCQPPDPDKFDLECLRLEAVITCVGFDDMLDVSLTHNHGHLDTAIIVTTHEDKKTQAVAKKHGAICVQTDLFKKNGRKFNKGAAVNAGFGRYQYNGWRMHLDADIILPDNFKRVLFNHTPLERHCIYGCDRVDVIGIEHLERVKKSPQHQHGFLVIPPQGNLSARYLDNLRAWVPIGFLQLWHASTQKDYPYSLGSACHDDVMFAEQWPQPHRRLLPSVVVGHLCSCPPKLGENWDGNRKQPRLH